MSVQAPIPIVTNGLILCLDAANTKSYPGTGTTWYDLGPNKIHNTINGTISFVSAGAASYFNFASVSDTNYIYSTTSQTYLDMTIALLPDLTYTGPGLAGLIANGAPGDYTDKSLRFRTGSNSWVIANQGNTDLNDWTYGSTTTYYVNGTPNAGALVSGWNILGGYRTNQNTFPSSFNCYLGSSGYPGRGYKGRIAYVAMYNRLLTATEQLQNYNAIKSRFGL